MRPITIIILCWTVSLFSCKTKMVKQGVNTNLDNQKAITSLPVDESKLLTTIALGSCSRPDYKQPLWKPILNNQPDLFIWLGDNVYGDTEDMKVLQQKYDAQKQIADYQKLLKNVPVIGIWDDHDYGVNDGGKEYPKRKESRDILFDFLDIPTNNPAWSREGAYQSYTFGPAGKQVKILLLDARYFRDQVIRKKGQNPQYIPNKTGTILGEKQWAWLEAELQNSTADMHIIGSGIQIIPTEHNFEKWNTFPQERKRLLDLIAKYNIPGTIFISGDRHLGELMKIDVEGLDYPIYELTTSGLTHTYNKAKEDNQYRVGNLTGKLNFGQMNIDWSKDKPAVTFKIKGEADFLYITDTVQY